MAFEKVLVVAIILFAALLLVFGGEFDIDRTEDPDPDRYGFRPIYPEHDFFVGMMMETDFSHRILTRSPFELSFDETERLLAELKDVDVRRGWLRNEPHYLEFNLTEKELENMKKVEMGFEVEDTNELNEMKIDFNEEEIYSGYPGKGEVYGEEIDLDTVQQNNLFEIYAESSGWRFWAPTVYTLDVFEVSATVLESEDMEFDFELDEEQAQSFEMGRLVLRPDRFVSEEPLFIEVNGEIIFEERAEAPDRGSKWIEFDYFDAELREGKNTIRMFTEKGGVYRFRGASLVVFWETPEAKMPVKYIDTTRSDYNRLPGEITFRVDAIEGMPEYLSLKMTTADEDERELMIEEPLTVGETVSIDITRDDLAVGENKLKFIVGGDGGYYLSNFQVRY